MKSFDYTITDDVGIHARPAGTLAKAAKDFQAKIEIQFNGKTAEITRLISVMSLGIKKGDTIKVTAKGNDEDNAISKMEQLFKENL